MDYIIIDSTDGINLDVTSLHVRNSMLLSEYLKCPLIGSKVLPKELIKKYDVIIFVHASGYTNVNAFEEFMKINKHSKFYYVKNEYNLGEAVILWAGCRDHNIKFEVIANHNRQTSKSRFVSTCTEWHIVNLNVLIHGQFFKPSENSLCDFFDPPKKRDIVYYGACRRNRVKYFLKYFDEDFIISTSPRNKEFYLSVYPHALYIDRLNWTYGMTLADFRSSLYIEDEYTHDNYNFLANRFYESLNFNVPCFFDKSCMGTISKSGYPINPWYIVDSREELNDKLKSSNWADYGFDTLNKIASEEKQNVLKQINEIVSK